MRLGVVVWIIAYSCVSRWNFLIEAESLHHTAKQNKLSAIFTLLAFSAQFIPDTLSLFTSTRLIVTWTSRVKTKFSNWREWGRGVGQEEIWSSSPVIFERLSRSLFKNWIGKIETRIIVTFEILNLIWSLNRVKLEFEGTFGILNLIRNSWSRERNSNSRPVTEFVEA